MRSGRLLPLPAMLLLAQAACGPAAVDRLLGEIHLHQTPTAAHLTALFIDPPTPVGETYGDSALPTRTRRLYEGGGCVGYEVGGCTTACDPPKEIDGGEVVVDGLGQPVAMRYQAAFGGYEGPIFDGQFLTAGTEVSVRGAGGAKVPAFEHVLRIPEPLAPRTTLSAGTASGVEIDWPPSVVAGSNEENEDAAAIEVLVSVTPRSGRGAVLLCQTPDGAGHYRIPDAALAVLPPAPRALQIEISRQRTVRAPLGDGRGVVVHAGYAVIDGVDEP